MQKRNVKHYNVQQMWVEIQLHQISYMPNHGKKEYFKRLTENQCKPSE